MAKYRTLKAVALVQDGKAVSVKAGRIVDLTDEQAEKLGSDKVVREEEKNTMFPTGAPNIPAGFLPPPVVAPTEPAPKVETPKPSPKPKFGKL